MAGFIAEPRLGVSCLQRCFALFYWIGKSAASRNVPGAAYIDYLYFSIETLSTAGYGDMHPQPITDILSQRWNSSPASFDVADDGLIFAAVLAAECPIDVRRLPGHFNP